MTLFLMVGQPTLNPSLLLMTHLSQRSTLRLSNHTTTVLHPLSTVHLVEVLFALNAVGSKFGCPHSSTSFRLYSSFCIPILLYGCELWSSTSSEATMLERVHRKILRTIQCCPYIVTVELCHSQWVFPVFCPSFTKDNLSSHIPSLHYPLILCLI